MKSQRQSLWTTGLSTMMVLAWMGMVTQQVAAQEVKSPAAGIANVDAKTTGSTVRASKLIGMNLYNREGQGVGEIKDLVLDATSGQVEYVAVTYGGFLGVGNKMFAVPFAAIHYEAHANDANNRRLVLHVTKEQLEGAVGFDEEHWPDFADTNFTNDLYKRYRIERRDRDGTRRGVDVQIDRNGVDVQVDKK